MSLGFNWESRACHVWRVRYDHSHKVQRGLENIKQARKHSVRTQVECPPSFLASMEEVWKDINVFQDLTTIDSPNIILSSASSETGFSLPHFHFQSQPSSQHPPPSNKTSAQPPAADRRNKRMIKNRESAARSRARKQEYYISRYFLILFTLLYYYIISIITTTDLNLINSTKN